MIRRLAYAALFVVALPVLLAMWARRLDALIPLPLPPSAIASPVTGFVVLTAGMLLMLAATRDLWRFGHGLPASPFPPERLVSAGTYRIFANPIYVGAVWTSVGASLAARSPAGLWIVSPALALLAATFVLGYERDATRLRFGASATPLLRLPPSDDARPSMADRVSVYLLVMAPWLVLYQSVEYLGTPGDARSAYLPWEASLPVLAWTEWIYAGTYAFVLAAPLAAHTRRALREFAVSGLVATAVIIPFYPLAPVVAAAKPVEGDGLAQELLRWERLGDAPVTAFPSFHVVWTCLAARVFAARAPRLRWLWRAIVAAVAVASITTGMHAIADVVAGLAAFLIVVHRGAIWNALRLGAERVANSWGEKTVGPVRLLSHGVFAGIGAALSIALSAWLAGSQQLGWLVGLLAGSIVGAALWGQAFEGTSSLLRPYGYFGAVVGTLAVTLAAAVSRADAWLVFCAFGVGSTVASVVGRFRCLVQGCCHGRESPECVGIRFTDPHSRVVRLSALGGVPVHPTQLYAMACALVVGCVLVRLWVLAAPLSFIAGTYFLLTGMGRFVEEHFRGEPQTVTVAGLRVYQWLALGFVVGGAALTCIRTASAPAPQPIDASALPALLVIAVVTYAAYGMDLPRSTRRFARLT